MYKSIKLFWLGILAIIPTLVNAQDMNKTADNMWQTFDSLMDLGNEKDALKQLQQISEFSKKNKLDGDWLQAEIVGTQLKINKAENDDTYKLIADLSKKPNNAVHKSLIDYVMALSWKQHYNSNWEIRDRTPVANKASDMEPQEWTSNQYLDTIQNLFQSALSAKSVLEQTSVSPYKRLFFDRNEEDKYFPYQSLYELMLLDYVENQNYDLNNRTTYYQNQIKGEKEWLLSDGKSFSQLTILIEDSILNTAIQQYQKILRYYADNNNKQQFAAWDLKRLSFLKEQLSFENEEEIYIQAVETLQLKNEGTDAALQAWLLVQNNKLASKTITKKAFATELQEKIAQYPKTNATRALQERLAQLSSAFGSIKIEKYIVPHEANKFLIQYQNIDQAKVNVIPYTPQKKNEKEDDYTKRISSLKPVYTYNINLPGATDMETHTVEHVIDGLPTGNYMIFIDQKNQNNEFSFADFHVTNLTYVQHGKDIYVLDRNSGKPISGAQIKAYRNNKVWFSGTTNQQGIMQIKSSESYLYLDSLEIVGTNGDKFLERYQQLSITDGKNIKNEETIRHFLYTDRSIYRPGQKVYFKGILVSKTGRITKVIANKEVEVSLYDANYQLVKKQRVTTNEFGSFSGTFDAPSDGLTGRMHIQTANGSAYFNVEEYKRPKFYATFDTLNKAYFVQDEIKVSGKAVAYAGNNINDATVSYSIERQVNFPYRWRCFYWPMPDVRNTVVAIGTTVTDANGGFDIAFKAIPDNTNPELWPTFTYSINIKITDISGETHEFTQSVNAAYKDLLIQADLPKMVSEAQLKNFDVLITNVNYIPQVRPYTVKVSKLEAPIHLRDRNWETPDQFLYDEATFKRMFPKDVYKDELTPEKMPVASVTFEQTFSTSQKIDLAKLKAITDNGWYEVSISSADIKGNKVEQKLYTYALINENQDVVHGISLSANKNSIEPQEHLQVKVWHPKNVQVFTSLSSLAEMQPSNIYLFQIKEEHRGGLVYESFYVKDNRFYATNMRIDVPYTNKDLHITWESHRDKLLPGSKETWRFKISGNKAKAVEAELLASLYDASLDAIKAHNWDYSNLMPELYRYNSFRATTFGINQTGSVLFNKNQISYYNPEYLAKANFPVLSFDRVLVIRGTYTRGNVSVNYGAPVKSISAAKKNKSGKVNDDVILYESSSAPLMDAESADKKVQSEKVEDQNLSTSQSPIRSNFKETAFFFPQMSTDIEGAVSFEFTIPEALTSWRLQTIAHTKDWQIGYLQGQIKTQKEVMVQPNMPRFFRQGDAVVLSTKVVNMTTEPLEATVNLSIDHPETSQDLNTKFAWTPAPQKVTIPAGQSKEVVWNIRVPESVYEPVRIRMVAQAGAHTDGEEHIIPVITNRMLVTETMTLPMEGNGTKSFAFQSLLDNKSTTLAHKALTVEYSSNPTWYVIQALPYLTNYPYDCAEQLFSKFYGNAIAADIMQQSPRMKEIIDQWKTVDTAAFLSQLEKNQELKTALLEETPWVLEAENESAQKQRITALFETNRISKELNRTLNLLAKRQSGSGAFTWFEGMYEDRYMTQTIVLGLLKMQNMNINVAKQTKALEIVTNAYDYLESKLKEDYKDITKYKRKKEDNNLNHAVIQYMLIDALGTHKTDATIKQYYLGQIKKYWNNYGLMTQAQMAMILYKNKDQVTAKQIIESLRQRAVINEEMGMYWKQNLSGYYWYEAPIETQATLIEAFKMVDAPVQEITQMQTWLLKNKQTNRWHSTKATVDASYAILNANGKWIEASPKVSIDLGNQQLEYAQGQAGTGYFKQHIAGMEITPNMGNISVTVSNAPTTLPSWGAVYWQYFEQMDKIVAANGELKIYKQVFVEQASNKGAQLIPITEGSPIKIGDKVVVRLVLSTDRDLEYVHIKDTRAGCLEPKDVLSQYHYAGGLGYYQSTKDISTNFFVDRMPKGTYVLEYVTYANAKGNYSSGIASIQCMYAPEFSAHSNGSVMEVK